MFNIDVRKDLWFGIKTITTWNISQKRFLLINLFFFLSFCSLLLPLPKTLSLLQSSKTMHLLAYKSEINGSITSLCGLMSAPSFFETLKPEEIPFEFLRQLYKSQCSSFWHSNSITILPLVKTLIISNQLFLWSPQSYQVCHIASL